MLLSTKSITPFSSVTDGSNAGIRWKSILGKRFLWMTSSKRCFAGRIHGTVWHSWQKEILRAKRLDLDRISIEVRGQEKIVPKAEEQQRI